MIRNPMDNTTAKEQEKAMGLSDAQKAELEAVGLTKAEIKEIHAKRLADSIAKERSRLDKMEKKVKQYLPDYLAEMLEGEGTDKMEEYHGEVLSPEDAESAYQALKSQVAGERHEWEGRKDLIMSNADYWKEVAKAVKGDPVIAEMPDNLESMTDEEFNAFYTRWQNALSKKTSSILERRQLGAIKAENDWIRGHCKGPRPENIAMLML